MIEFTCYEEMADNVLYEIREAAFAKFDLACMHIYHSLGQVKAGDICFFVFVSSRHRADCDNAVMEIVEAVKEKVPIFGKELLDSKEAVWKENR